MSEIDRDLGTLLLLRSVPRLRAPLIVFPRLSACVTSSLSHTPSRSLSHARSLALSLARSLSLCVYVRVHAARRADTTGTKGAEWGGGLF